MSLLIGLVAAVYLSLLALLFVFQRNLLYVPSAERPSLAEAGLASTMRAVELKTSDGLALLAWYRAPPTPDAPVLLYYHGNAGHIGNRADKVKPYLDAGYGVLLPEYRGYGGNPGRPTEEGLYTDARAAIGFVVSEGISPARIVCYGESLGTGVAVQMATEHSCGALVLEAPFTSVAAVAQARYPIFPVKALVLDKFDSLAKIGRLRCPLFIMHGERDRIVPIRYGRALFAAAPEPKEAKWYPEVNHVDFEDFGGSAAVLDFLRRHLQARKVSSPGS
jgi:fermentation-respiration switch protein FrsA (DUF1100 family)